MHRQIGILLKKLASGVARSIQKGLCVTGLMLVWVCVEDYQREMLQKLIIKISDSAVDKSVQSV